MTQPAERWSFPGLTTRVRFDPAPEGAVASELDTARIARPLLVTTERGRSASRSMHWGIEPRLAGVYTGSRVHVPRVVAEEAKTLAARTDADGVIALGGGAAVGLAKILALESGLPYIAIPTTYAGSEMSPIWGTTDEGRKTTGRDDVVRARAVLYFTDLTLSLPARESVLSGLNAIAHAAEARCADDASPLTWLAAEAAVANMSAALRILVDRPDDRAARRSALTASWLASACLATTTMGIHHRLCHILGGMFDLPHAALHAAVLPYALALELMNDSGARRALATAAGGEPEGRFRSLALAVDSLLSLRALGVPESSLSEVADVATSHGSRFTRHDVERMLRDAFEGNPATGE